jgi:hypothetical protein
MQSLIFTFILFVSSFSAVAIDEIQVKVNSKGIYIKNDKVDFLHVIKLSKLYTSNKNLKMKLDSEFYNEPHKLKYTQASFFNSNNKLVANFRIDYTKDSSTMICVFMVCTP